MNYFYSMKYHVPVAKLPKSQTQKEILARSAVLRPVIILGDRTGVTPTNPALAVSTTWRLVPYTKLPGRSWESLRDSPPTISIFLMGATTVIGWLLKWDQVPQRFAALLPRPVSLTGLAPYGSFSADVPIDVHGGSIHPHTSTHFRPSR